MAITISRDVFCDIDLCGCWTEGCIQGNAGIARRAAKKRGWKRLKRGGVLVDVCPGCQTPLNGNSKGHRECFAG